MLDRIHHYALLYLGPRMVMAGAGGVNHQELCDLTAKHFGKIGHTYDAEIPLDLNCRYTGRYCKI